MCVSHIGLGEDTPFIGLIFVSFFSNPEKHVFLGIFSLKFSFSNVLMAIELNQCFNPSRIDIKG